MGETLLPERLPEGVLSVVLVEGESDRAAVETAAVRMGRDLGGDGISVVAMGGATNIGHYLARFGPDGQNLRLAGLCDVNEESYFRREIEHLGLGRGLSRSDMEALGFYVCVEDLEDELIRALGTGAVEAFIEGQGELQSLRTLQNQPAHRGGATEQHLRRFMGSRSGRKLRYAAGLVSQLDSETLPRPLVGLLTNL